MGLNVSTILIVDDSTMIVDVFVAMLQRHGYETLSAYGGHEAVEVLKKKRPDLILLDIMMEPMDGWSTLTAIKNNPETVEIPVMMLTAKQLNPDEAQLYGALIEDYIMKPTTHKQLYEAVDYVLSRRETIAEGIKKARDKGLDAELIEEYEQLSTSVDVSRRLLHLLSSTYRVDGTDLAISKNIVKAIDNIEESISLQDQRLKELKSMIG